MLDSLRVMDTGSRAPDPDPDEMAADRVLAIDNVPLALPIAGAGTRSLAASIDYLIVSVLALLIIVACFVAGAALGLTSLWWLAVLLLALFALEYGYFAVSEIVMSGQTVGKRAVGLRVVGLQGSRPGNAALLLRNAVRNVDLLIGVPMMAIDPLSRRLGDRLAGTLVVRTRRGDAALVHRVPKGWGARQIEVLEGFLRRCDELEPERAERLARALIATIEKDDPEFLVPGTGLSPVVRLQVSVEETAGLQ
jgi:uncharacterized RDD family membrane protein YckC